MQVKNIFKQGLENVRLRALHYRQIYQFERSPLRRKEPLLVYQMGKVGSSTVRRSITASNLDIQPYHLHYMSGIDYMVGLCRAQSLPLQDHILSSIYCKKLIRRKKADGKKINVITLVREPISKNISQFFQNIEVSYPEYGYSEKANRLSPDELVLDLIAFFIQNFRHDDPLVWFDQELKQFMNIDVFETDFPHEKGYQVYENESFRVLLIRLENLNTCIAEAMGCFLDIEDFKLANENISSEKEYADLYKKMKKKIKLPDTYIEKMYSSKMAKHFYTEREIKAFEMKWRNLV